MTPTEIAVVIACLFGGYWLVGRMMAGSRPDEAGTGPDDAQDGAHGSLPGFEDPTWQDAPRDGRRLDWQGNEMPPADEAPDPTRRN